jgi:hypothetical protein
MPKAKQRDDVPTRGFLMKAERWLYPGGRPNGLARLLNRGWATSTRLGCCRSAS